MATTQLADIIIPEVYLSYDAEVSPELTAFFESGIVVQSPLLNSLAVEGGNTFNIPFWKDLDSSVDPLLSSDDPAAIAAAQKLATAKQIGRSAFLNQWYSNADLTSEIAGSDANQQVRNRFGAYWTRQWQRRLIATVNGVLADNIANDAGDMVNDIASESVAGQGAGTLWSRAAFTTAVFTLGDAFGGVTGIGVHSKIYKDMVDADDIDYVKDSSGTIDIPTFMGKRVIVDDSMTVTAGTTDGLKYTTVLFGAGSFGYGEGTPNIPVETTRDERAGNGGGVEYIGERKTWILHPFGYQNTGTPAADSFSLTELAAATTWDRVVDRKNVPLAFLITN